MRAEVALVVSGLVALVLGALLLVTAPPRPPARMAALSPLAAQVLGPMAYRLHAVPPEDPDLAIRSHFEKSQVDSGGLVRAELASAYLAKARAGGGAFFYLLADRAARESLEALPVFNEGALIVLARVAEARHDFPLALELANRVLKEKPQHPGALAVRYTVALARGRLAEALGHATTLLERYPGTGTYAQRAAVYLAQGRDARAAADLRRAIALEEAGELDASARARTLLGRLAWRRGELQLASALFREALRIRPRFAPALIARGELELATGRSLDAAPELLAADAAVPTPAFRVLAARLLARRDPAAAAALSARTEADVRRDLTGGGLGHRRDLAALLLVRGAVSEALSLARAEAGLRRDAATLDLLARALLAAGLPAEARTVIDEALAPPADAAGEDVRPDPALVATRDRIAEALARSSERSERAAPRAERRPRPATAGVGRRREPAGGLAR